MAFFTGIKNPNIIEEESNLDNTIDYYVADIDQNAPFATIKNSDESIKNSINASDGFEGNQTFYSSLNAAQLFITHAATGYAVQFPAILDSYNESFKPTYSQEQVYGRMDAIQKYVNTSRTISVTFKVLAYDEDQANKNINALSTLAQFMYPVYDYGEAKLDGRDLPYKDALNNATAIRESPLLRIKFANLIQRTNRIFKRGKTAKYINTGLLVAPTSFSFEPDKEMGYFVDRGSFLHPKQVKVTLSLNVLHEDTLGWKASNDDMTDFRWIGNLDDYENLNAQSVVFPWGDEKIKIPPQTQRTLVSDNYTDPSGTPLTDEERRIIEEQTDTRVANEQTPI